MKLIPLSQGKFAMVDDEDYDRLMQYKWYAAYANGTWYARRTVRKRHTVRMHHEVLQVEPSIKLPVDHEDGDGLNNQKYNISVSTRRKNARNTKRYRLAHLPKA